jgi:hypothetical protein
LDNSDAQVTACIILDSHSDLYSALYMAVQFDPDEIIILSDAIVITSNLYNLNIRVAPMDTLIKRKWRIVPRFPNDLLVPDQLKAMAKQALRFASLGKLRRPDDPYTPTEAEKIAADIVIEALIAKIRSSI